MPSSQSSIFDHFAPKSQTSSPLAPFRQGGATRRQERSDSEGSEGLAGIRLSPTKQPSRARAWGERRGLRRRVDQSDADDDGDGEVGQSTSKPAMRRRASADEEVQLVDPPQASAMPKRRSARRPQPIVVAQTASALRKSTAATREQPQVKRRRKVISVELPSLSLEERSQYSPLWSGASIPQISAQSRRVSPVGRPDTIAVSDTDSDNVPLTSARRKRTAANGVPRPPPSRQSRAIGKNKKAKSPSSSEAGTSDSSVNPRHQALFTRPGRKAVPRLVGIDDSESDMSRRTSKKPALKGNRKTHRADPDDSEDAVTEEEDYAHELEFDEPERFKSETRLRKRQETDIQRTIRKNRNKRLGIVEETSEEDDQDDQDDGEESSGSEDFITDEGDECQPVALPHEFSLDSAQTPEFKFKVVFHYLLLLAMRGPTILPLKGDMAEYFRPQLRDLRRRMDGFKDGQVRSQIWQPRFVKILEKYPDLEIEILDHLQVGCDACRRSLYSRYQVSLRGEAYDRETHQLLDESSEDVTDSSETSDTARRMNDRQLLMGAHCSKRAQVFHAMSHWEDELFDRIRIRYHDLLRAKGMPVPSDSEASSDETDSEEEGSARRAWLEERREHTRLRVQRMKRDDLPRNASSVDQVLTWMDGSGYQRAMFKWMEDLVEQCRRLEHDKSKDE